MAEAKDRSSLGQLVGAGRSRLSLVGAMRAREVSRPTEADRAAAEPRASEIISARVAGRARWVPPADNAPLHRPPSPRPRPGPQAH